jgi:hypothetical protein
VRLFQRTRRRPITLCAPGGRNGLRFGRGAVPVDESPVDGVPVDGAGRRCRSTCLFRKAASRETDAD